MIKVLVIDDEEMIRFGVMEIIRRQKSVFQVIGEAGSGEEGMKLVRQLKPDIVITDIRMPKGDGFTVLKKLREEGFKCKSLVLTAHADFEYARSAVRFGAAGYILKPIDEEELISEMIRIISETIIIPVVEPEKVIAIELIENVIKNKSGIHPIVYKTLKYISSNFKNNISLNDISMELNISSAYICSLFTKSMNVSLVNFLNIFRVDIAKKLLVQKKYKINEISERLGFNDPKYFCKVFNSIVKVSPSDYANNNFISNITCNGQ